MQPSILKTLARLSFSLEISTGGKLETDWCFFSVSLVTTSPEIPKGQQVVSNQALGLWLTCFQSLVSIDAIVA